MLRPECSYCGIGTDTGGSIRIPAAWCGLTGLKPTFGLVPKSGCLPVGFSLDTIGPIARSAWDCAAVLGCIAGGDRTDPDSLDTPTPDYIESIEERDLKGLVIGVAWPTGASQDLDPALCERFEAAVSAVRGLGAAVVETSLPYYEEMRTVNRLTLVVDAATYHWHSLRTHWGEYNQGTRMFLAQSAFISATDYIQAQRVRRTASRKVARLFGHVDLVLTPTTGTAAVEYGDDGRLPSMDVVTKTWYGSYWNALGYPSIAMPIGHNADGMPLSCQFSGRPCQEVMLLQAAHAYQSNTLWHLRRAPSLVRAASHE